MRTTLARTVAWCAGMAVGSAAAVVQAQTADQGGALSAFVNDARTGSTDLQRQAGFAVQGMCSRLAAEGGLRLTGAKQDLFLRCNEMVETARVFQGIAAGTGRTLGYTDRAQLLAAIQQVSGEEVAAQGVLATQVSAGQFANISGRLSALRLGGASSSARGRVARLQSAGPAVLAMANGPHPEAVGPFGGGASADSQSASSDERPVGWFVESSYGFGDHDQTVSEDAFDFDSVSVTTGSDYNFGSGVLGFSVGYDRYTADFDTAVLVNGGEVEVDGVSGSLFGGLFTEGWTLNAIATYGQLNSDVTRRVVYDSANAACSPSCGAFRSITGSPDGSYLAVGVTAGFEITAGGWEISPSLSASYRDVDIDGYDENDPAGGLALRYEDQTIESMRSIVSVAVARPISRSFGVLVPTFRAEWHHEFEDDVRAVRAKYVLEDSLLAGGSAGRNFACTISCFTMLTDRADADFAIAGAGLSATFAQRTQVYLFYEALLGAANVSGSSIAVGIRGQF